MSSAKSSPPDGRASVVPIETLLLREYGLDTKVTRLAGESENYLAVTPDGARYVFKRITAEQSADLILLEHAVMDRIEAAGIGLELPRIVPTTRGTLDAGDEVPGVPADHRSHGRLTRFVSGIPWCEAGPASPARRALVGRCLARLALGLAPLDHPAGHRTHRWDLTVAGTRRRDLSVIENPARRRMAEEAFVLWAAARPYLDELPHSLIHGDLNDENVLIAADQPSGLLDFGDCLYNPTVCELAIALTYLLLDEVDPLAAGAEIVAAYHQIRPLSGIELEVLFPLICGRLALSVVIAAERRRIDPNRTAWFVTEARAWRALEGYARVAPVTAATRLAAGTNVTVFPERGAASDELVRRRRVHVSGALSLSYREPVRFIRGRAQFLFDETGSPYLDLYNNVCHVGHCHPRVVAAGQRQLARLNTNTRYLYDGLVEYAERLCATLPPQLSHCCFVNSGSEANELALRLAWTHTGHRDLVVLDHAYHGHTNTLIDISPYKFMGPGGIGRAQPWVHLAPIPDGYRGAHKGQDQKAGIAYGDAVGSLMAALGRPIAGFIVESLPSCAGQIIPPQDYLETAFRHVHRSGGVCIVDEVQTGFGRVGTHFWGFEQQGVVPDIVVMGKPMGNGHPIGAVVTTRVIADSFAATGMEFFSTFGGNPVSCAIGMAVLDVIREETLQANALRVGTALRDGLRSLMDRHALIGDVRGTGLFIGVELVRNRDTLEPATAEAAALVNGLRQRRILTGTDGPFENVIKIKGPLVLTEDDAAYAVAAFDEVLQSIS
jgi:4-aminobutyrate aminotransferase-like enzyme/Ser/Thr protein kinase RdoA (MazF antagonist)